MARGFAKRLDGTLAIIDKRRPKANVAEVVNVVGEVEDRDCLIVDDMITTAGTVTEACRILKDNGARDIYVAATHAVFAAAVKHSPLLGDFLGMAVADQYRRFGKTISNKMFADYLDGCRERDPLMPAWTEETRERIRCSGSIWRCRIS